MPTKEYKGIYIVYINNKPYVGKDSNIFQSRRLTNHLASLRNGKHNNKRMQDDFNEYGEKAMTYSILCFSRDYTEEELRELEKYYVEKLDSMKNGYNETDGGVGMWGYKFSEESLEKRSINLSGEQNPSSKLTNKEFFEIVDFLKKGYTNEEIADLYGLHSRYISLIRHKKRFKRLWEKVYYIPQISTKQLENRKLSYNLYFEILNKLQNGAKNAEIEREYELSSGTASRLKHGKLYKDFFDKYINRNN